MYPRKLALAVAVGAVTLLPLPVFAHGDSHEKKAAARPAHVDAEEHSFGRAGDPKKVSRTITVGMHDTMHFFATAAAPRERTTDVRMGDAPHAMSGDLVVKRGETIRFIVHNDGKIMHEMVIGTMQELKEHAELMRKFPNMEHDEPYMAHVAPGKRAELVWQFTKAGEFHYACLIPGHLEAGMIAKITVK